MDGRTESLPGRRKGRFEAHLDGKLAGFAEYQLTDQLMVFTHTEVLPEFEGKGVDPAATRLPGDHLRRTFARGRY